MEDEEVAAPSGVDSADPLAGLSPLEMMREARGFVDPNAKFRQAAAGAMTPGNFATSYGAAMKAYADGADNEEKLVRQYLPIIQSAAQARQKQKQQLLAQHRAALDATATSTLMDPNFSPEGVESAIGALVQQGRVPPEMAEQYLGSLPKEGAALQSFLRRQAIAASDPFRAVKVPTVEKYGEGEVGYSVNPMDGTRTEVASGRAKPSDISRLLKEYTELPEGDPRRKFYESAINKAITHPPNSQMIVNAEKPLVGSFMESLGKSFESQREAAAGAKSSLSTSQRLLDAINTGKVVTGPGAPAELFLRQLGQYAGYGGKNNEEVLANTRNAIQAMAELELRSAGEFIKGQGAVTDFERALLARAASATNTLSPSEIRVIATLSARRARGRIAQYNETARQLSRMPAFSQLPGFAELVSLPESSPPGAESLGGDQPVLRFDAQGNPIESKR